MPALLGRYWLDNDTIAVLAGAAAMVGHTFPIFLGLGGGKGVATATGVTFALAPFCGLVGAVGFITVLWLFRYVSLASLTAAGTALAACLILQLSWPVIAFSTFAAVTVLLRHRTNLGRVWHGTEPRVRSFGRGQRSVKRDEHELTRPGARGGCAPSRGSPATTDTTSRALVGTASPHDQAERTVASPPAVVERRAASS